MRLFVAEKPSLGRAIAAELGVTKNNPTFQICGSDTVTWCFGHILEQYDPQDYDDNLRTWRRRDLPIIPNEWKLRPKKEAYTQLQVINHLLSEASSVVHAGDPDREGQLLVDEVLEHFHYTGPVQRIWLASLDSRSIQKALSTLKDNSNYANLRDAARARSQADWLIGMNASRAMTIFGQETGHTDGVLSLGRVQTPTLALVVQRDREIKAFVPVDYLILQASLQNDAGSFSATFKPAETQPGLDPEGRLVDASIAQGIVDAVRGQTGTITSVTREKKKKAVPLPHCLSSLQKAASSRFGMTAQQVLDTAQSLYEKKLTTYPRTDCRYLPEEQFQDAARIITSLAGVSGLEAVTARADTSLRGPVWDTKKITAHHAIIPTGEKPQSLTAQETNLYLMIAVQYCLQFYPPMSYEAQKIVVSINDTIWEARGRLILEPGWTGVAAEEDEDAKKKEPEQSLPPVSSDTPVTCADVETLKKKTTPPSRFSEGSLIEAMANIHRFVSDASAKATLKENEGLGTEATRASIIETLKGRKYIAPSGKSLVSTPIGQSLIDMTPGVLKDPVMTAQWEQRLEQIARGELTLDAFMQDQIAILPTLLNSVLSLPVTLLPGAFPCPKCGKAMRKRPDKKYGGFFWACSDPDCHTFLPDNNGKPGAPREKAVPSEFPCPVCGKPLYRKEKDGAPYWACYNREGHANGENVFLPDDNGKPGKPKPRAPRIVTEFVCPDCGKPLLLKNGTNTTGKVWERFDCSGFPQCKASFWGSNGKPDFDKRAGTK
ncbi:DNA topoisomerase III [Bilophila wadsworthia]|uniref:DNA topoisomerase III n=1 Tax=Bilophila wadsworthia TaxID=35833 RepID=UPI0032BF71CE